ncbi:MAG: hypothetical protein MUF45_10760 [Spirosomaceae bacterium]|jgi:hypothetical protein|nr:hypothetical protein [Spirosomataceae bacterium]
MAKENNDNIFSASGLVAVATGLVILAIAEENRKQRKRLEAIKARINNGYSTDTLNLAGDWRKVNKYVANSFDKIR